MMYEDRTGRNRGSARG